MKSAGVIYRQYRQVRKLALIRALSMARQRTHENCHYASVIQYKDVDGYDKVTKLCLLHPGQPDVCTNPRDCNAFAKRWTDDVVAEEFSKAMADDATKKRLFPELWAYEWMLDKSLTEAKKAPRGFSKMLVWMISILESVVRRLGGKKEIMGHGGSDAKA